MSVEIEVNGHTYRIGKLDAMTQFHITRRLGLLLQGADKLNKELMNIFIKMESGEETNSSSDLSQEDVHGMANAVSILAEGFAEMPDKDANYIILGCLGTVQRKQDSGGWADVAPNRRIMFQDIDMYTMIRLVYETLKGFLGDFFGVLPKRFVAMGQMFVQNGSASPEVKTGCFAQ